MDVPVDNKSPQAPVSTESLSPDTRREQFQGCRPAEKPQGGEDVQKPSQDVAVAVAEKETKPKDLGIWKVMSLFEKHFFKKRRSYPIMLLHVAPSWIYTPKLILWDSSVCLICNTIDLWSL